MSESQASPEDFKLDKGYEPLANKTLEEVISEGESSEEKETQTERITVNNYPQWIRSVGIHLKHKHRNATHVSVIERSMIKIGIAIARQKYHPLIQQVQSLRESIFGTGNQILLMKSYNTAYQPQETVGTIYHKVSIRQWEIGALTELLVEPLGLSSSAAILLTLICGVSTSVKWVPPRWVALANRETDNFHQYLEDEVVRLERVRESL
ncbi:hypothetical protein ES708_03675 [subsurface metagenome]